MERTAWTDERLDDAFVHLRHEMREMRNDMRELRHEVHADLAQIKLFMLGTFVSLLAAIIATNA